MGLTVTDIQRMADTANSPNPLVAGPGRQRIMALASDRGRFADDEAWLTAHDMARTWLARSSQDRMPLFD